MTDETKNPTSTHESSVKLKVGPDVSDQLNAVAPVELRVSDSPENEGDVATGLLEREEKKSSEIANQAHKGRLKRPDEAAPWQRNVGQFADCAVVCIITAVSYALTTFLFLTVMPGFQHTDPLFMYDTALVVGMLGLLVGFMAYGLFPLYLILLAIQLSQRTPPGEAIFDTLSMSLGVDPGSLQGLRLIMSPLLTLSFSFGPLLIALLYQPLLESSPFRSTLGYGFLGLMVGDRRGKKLSFRQALIRKLNESSLLWCISNLRSGKELPYAKFVDTASGTAVYKRPDEDADISKERNRLVINYRAFEELEKFLESLRRDHKRSRDDESDLRFNRGKWFVIANLLLMVAAGFIFVVTSPTAAMNMFLYGGKFFYIPIWENSANFFLTALMLFRYGLPLLGLYWLCALCRPSGFELSDKGIRFLSKSMPAFMQERVTPWSSITKVTLEQPANRSAIADARITFWLGEKKQLRLRIGSIGSVASRQEVLRAIERWAPQLPRDPKVIQALQPPCDYSYTDIWLEALTAPPKRDKLKPLAESATLRDGQYQVVREIGSGGQGFAYLAEDVLSAESIVLKEFVLPVYVDVSVRRTALERFEHEARLLKELSHPQVVKLLDYFVEDHRAYLVLEHIEGESLHALVSREGPLKQDRAIELAHQMCEILAYLHGQSPPVVHRDFTPDNLILRTDGTLKLIDFNVAQQRDSATVIGTAVGKPAYLPPEQFRGSAGPQSDIYAMGACLFYILTGNDPVPISISRPRHFVPEITPELDDLVAAATAPEMRERVANVDEFRKKLPL